MVVRFAVRDLPSDARFLRIDEAEIVMMPGSFEPKPGSNTDMLYTPATDLVQEYLRLSAPELSYAAASMDLSDETSLKGRDGHGWWLDPRRFIPFLVGKYVFVYRAIEGRPIEVFSTIAMPSTEADMARAYPRLSRILNSFHDIAEYIPEVQDLRAALRENRAPRGAWQRLSSFYTREGVYNPATREIEATSMLPTQAERESYGRVARSALMQALQAHMDTHIIVSLSAR